jgi:hypothetical protein
MHRFLEWRQMLGRAADVPAVEQVLRDYIEALGPEVTTLPPECQIALQWADPHLAAVTLLQEELLFEGPDDIRVLLQEISCILAAASVRIAALPDSARAVSQRPAASPLEG